MKVRLGFVSNSSSSSFSIFGVQTSRSDLVKVFKAVVQPEQQVAGCTHNFDRTKASYCMHCGAKAYITQQEEIDYDKIYSEAEKLGLLIIDTEYEMYCGVNLQGNGGKRAFVKNIEHLQEANKLLNKLFGQDGEFYSGEYPT